MHKKLLNLLGFVLLSSLLSSLWSQETDALASALRHVFDQAKAWGLQENDLAGMTLNDRYQSRHNGVTHLYFRQRHEGIGVHNAILGVHVATDGSVIHTGNRFVAQLREKINTTQALLSAQQAVLIAARHLGLELQSPLNIVDSRGKTEVLFSEAGISRVPIRAELVYQPLSSQAIRLAWDIFIDQVDASDYWSFRIDAVDGSVLGQDNFTTYCQWEGSPHHRHSLHCALPSAGIAGLGHMAPAMSANESSPNAGPMYHVFPVPVESPAHGERERVIDPVDPESSPLGWHSTGSLPEQQFTITRGNNVHAYLDLDNSDVSKNDEPDGGEALQFDFPFNPAWEPDRYRDFSVTQAFYMSNYLHDLAYRYGFDEEAGNFQQNNFGKGGRGGDPVHVHVQDGGSRNNANFTTPPDGARGRMQMYLWEQNRDRIFSVNAPESIAGFLPVSTAAFGPAIDSTPISGRLVAAFDGAAIDADKGCGTLINAEELRGNIALVNRGVCFFQEKALRAAAAGAKACIICNFEDALINMGGVSTLPAPTIPTLMLRASDCERLRQFFRQGVEVTLRLSPSEGPRFFDGALDNGIVAHEYAHGISMRLTGGPGVSSCLNNDEQMGEGWSDFFTLASTFRPDDSGEAPRGIGNYVLRGNLNSGGVRRLPYSTSMSVNNQSFDDIITTTSPHALGEIWTGMLWDLYWRFIEEYGWDDDLFGGRGGNNIALQLIMDGMKLQSCNPGFVDARDAIIAADIINNGGANECLILGVFARRGLGIDADQGSPFDRNDGTPSFDTRPECVPTLKIAKRANASIEAGDVVSFTLQVDNHKNNSLSDVVVIDELPQGLTYIAGSAQGAPFEVDQGLISFELGDLGPGQSRILRYQAQSSPDLHSTRLFFDDVEQGDNNWIFDNLNPEGFNIWEITDAKANSGRFSWFVPSTVNSNDQVLEIAQPIKLDGQRPALRFFHSYNTTPGLDAGFIEVSTDGRATWVEIPKDKIFKNGYRGHISYSTFSRPFLDGFWGDSRQFVDSYIDLSDYAEQEILFRFRFGSTSKPNVDSLPYIGWFVDDIEALDLFAYQSQACVRAKEGDQACAELAARGVIVEPRSSTPTSTDYAAAPVLRLRVYPNPAREWLNVAFDSPRGGEARLELFGVDGRSHLQRQWSLIEGEQLFSLPVQSLPGGVYFLRIQAGQQVSVEKVSLLDY